MKAITVHRPWDQAILYGGKDTENRTWVLWEKLWGVPIALHAGKRYDTDGAEWMKEHGLYVPPRDEDSPTGIVGVVVFSHVERMPRNKWYSGPNGWVIASHTALGEAIDIKGNQGLWKVPTDVVEEIDRQLGGAVDLGKATE